MIEMLINFIQQVFVGMLSFFNENTYFCILFALVAVSIAIIFFVNWTTSKLIKAYVIVMIIFLGSWASTYQDFKALIKINEKMFFALLSVGFFWVGAYIFWKRSSVESFKLFHGKKGFSYARSGLVKTEKQIACIFFVLGVFIIVGVVVSNLFIKVG